MSDTDVTIVRFRDAEPPHGTFAACHPDGLRYGFKLRRLQTASFLLSRSDPNWPAISARLRGAPLMVTVERPDGYLPFVGFVSQVPMSLGDPNATFQLADHAWRLQAARTRKAGTYNTASGRLIKDVLRDMEQRAEPALFLRLDAVDDGRPVNYALRMDKGLDFLEAIARASNMEWGFAYRVTPAQVETYLLWQYLRGADRRTEDVWREQKHFTSVSYGLDYANGVAAAVAVGGSGTFGDRPSGAVNTRGGAPDVTPAKVGGRGIGLGGTRVAVSQRVTDAQVLQTMARQLFDAPEYATEQISFSVSEGAVDMSRLEIGDRRTVWLETTVPGAPVERDVRITAIELKPDAGIHDIEAIVI